MFQIIIDNSTTYVYRDDNNMLMGFLINHEGIKEIIESLPVSKYSVVYKQGRTEEISKKQAFMLYDLILDYHKNNKEKRKKIKRDI